VDAAAAWRHSPADGIELRTVETAGPFSPAPRGVARNASPNTPVQSTTQASKRLM
jgi:hypothetical protein